MFNKALLLYKQSNYEIYFLNKNSSLFGKKNKDIDNISKRFAEAHKAHYKTLVFVEKVLSEYKIKYEKSARGKNIKYSEYDLIITVGGDGTFLEASRKITGQLLIGVNSDTKRSVGKLCTCTSKTFKTTIHNILKNKYTIKKLHRLQIEKNNKVIFSNCLNEILICHSNPGAMSRYFLDINGVVEEQFSSGIWIATPCGSTGAISSAGGKKINKYNRSFQFLARELYDSKRKKYFLTSGIANGSSVISIHSLMRNGKLFIDGNHYSCPITYGDILKVYISPNPLDSVEII
ncbi:MAG: NAD(+)/NADH kinase [Candidatus Omnitrophica bacterium]|nr:NAD(+)/NADH kinase [Candidatus Omnitrophota bacterium]MBU1996285.1 NAD(+)/NADH kinase [Candidatus Omnitrophota bacterium]MBU4333713.1 NAD(+)/NADH kinase [Candidatus Omnitrophota bacterium]